MDAVEFFLDATVLLVGDSEDDSAALDGADSFSGRLMHSSEDTDAVDVNGKSVVVVGAGTALADNPQLTVRRVAGPQPARVVIDPGGRLPAGLRLFAADGVRRVVITGPIARPPLPADIEVTALPRTDGQIAPQSILQALATLGLRRVLIQRATEKDGKLVAPAGTAEAFQKYLEISPEGAESADAKAMPGVLGVWTGADLNAAGYGLLKTLIPVPNRDGTPMKTPARHSLATDKVRFVGDPVAFVVAETVAQVDRLTRPWRVDLRRAAACYLR